MRIAIIHYHLFPGGVTRIIESQVNALLRSSRDIEITVYAGEGIHPVNPSNPMVKVKEETSLRYLEDSLEEPFLSSHFQQMVSFLEKIGRENDVIHLHNPGLGKNPLLTLAVFQMARKGKKMINHCHDFAEDRPALYTKLKSILEGVFRENIRQVLYPAFRNFHYVVLTSTDQNRLLGYGIPPGHITLLPNPVSFSISVKGKFPREKVKERLGIPQSMKLCLYPVRAIERKNIGEFILFSFLFRREAAWLITQPPRNPKEIPGYEQWKDFCTRLAIPVIFEAGQVSEIRELLHAADCCFTTSIMEGFGMAYIEPWLAGVPVVGRNLPNCTDDLIRNGIRFPLLYDRFIVSFNAERRDFRDLSKPEQQQLIQEVIERPEKESELMMLNPFLNRLLNNVRPEMIRHNQRVIARKYSLKDYGKQLYGIYQKLSETD